MSEYDDGYECGREKGLDAVSRGGGMAFCFEDTYTSIAETMTLDEGSDFYQGVRDGLAAVQEEFENGEYDDEENEDSKDDDDSNDDDSDDNNDD
jgi:hypothetical protein